ncbi:AGL144Cp [Eremothecium gossypii ATCC 10895]|uniref:Kinase n=1 Tax=Eremothecium gossypii (strain ATCC 10895 / CBS 109.51 / FGSC 9923 / NRRL Y-1056) TaxID=284811 RepID=Q750T3_EREGS|nr:AGL144Cp [Eremothecium gossypii ATCC 10895]AAS54347.2 AGL144Cp [Eremothecium gossypii ATCC 10895]AEY98674.1 FAGL144Cp [Eremothecium gossypii FDAG1]
MGHKKLRHQAAGHDGTLTDIDERLIFKPAVDQELEFYTGIISRKDREGVDFPLECWMCVFVGTLSEGILNVENNDSIMRLKGEDVVKPTTDYLQHLNLSNDHTQKYLVLENLTYGYRRPNILDIKLGKVLYDDKATEEKKARLTTISASTTSGSLGFRVCGMKIERNSLIGQLDKSHYEEDDDDYVLLNKLYGRSRTVDNVSDAFRLFFNAPNLPKHRHAELINRFAVRLRMFYNTLLDEEVRMISSSLLFVYEGDPERWDMENAVDGVLNEPCFLDGDSDCSSEEWDKSRNIPLSSMTLIDFAHSKFTPGEGYDENVIVGVENLMEVFDKVSGEYGEQ